MEDNEVVERPTESPHENEAVTRRWFTEGWTTNADLADEVFDTEFATNGIVVGIEGPRSTVLRRLDGFPDLSTVIEDVVATGDMVVIRVLWRGTHTGSYAGLAPTGKHVSVRVISMWRFERGKVVENWTLQDQFGLLQQVGYLSPELTTAQGTTTAQPTKGV